MRKILFLQFSLAITLFFVFFLGTKNVSAYDTIVDTTSIPDTSYFNFTNACNNAIFLDTRYISYISTTTFFLFNNNPGDVTVKTYNGFGGAQLATTTIASLNNDTTTEYPIFLDLDTTAIDYLIFITCNSSSLNNNFVQSLPSFTNLEWFDELTIRQASYVTGLPSAYFVKARIEGTSEDPCPACETCTACETCGEVDLYDPVAYGTTPDISIVYNKEYKFTGTSTIPDETVYSYSYSPFIQYLYFFSLFSAVILVIFVFKKLISNK